MLLVAMVLTMGANFCLGLATLILLIRKNGHSSGAKDPAFWIAEHDKSVRRALGQVVVPQLNEIRRRVGLQPFVPTVEE